MVWPNDPAPEKRTPELMVMGWSSFNAGTDVEFSKQL
jgi:hypothetical protein